MAIEFTNDNSYLYWIANHPEGYVLNMRKNKSPGYMVLHKATCYSITNLNRKAGAKEGGFTEHDYLKVGAENVGDLRAWTRSNGRPDGSFSNECSFCKPT